MKQYPRNLVAVMVVATAMLADRAAVAAPVSRPHAVEAAGRWVDRLADRFCRTVAPATARFYRPMAQGLSRVERVVPVVADRERTHRPSEPFRYRLPPPWVA